MVKIATVFGTRPEIIKMSQLIPLFDKHFDHKFVYTGQHFSENMKDIFFSELKVRNPDVILDSKSSDYQVLIKSSVDALREINPDYVLVYGDTNSTLSASVAAKILNRPIIHVEAGLRSFDKEMFEEVNRIVTDHFSKILFTPTKYTEDLLHNEGIFNNVFVVGNTIVDAVKFYSDKIAQSRILEKMNFSAGEYVLLTLHRQETVDRPDRLEKIIAALSQIDQKIVFPVHPRTELRLNEFNISLPKNVTKMPPIGYFDFLKLLENSFFVMTDSGGVQEEAITVKTPCITLRKSTERMETIEAGANFLVGFDTEKIVNHAKLAAQPEMQEKVKAIRNPYGDGTTSKQIVEILEKNIETK